MPEASLDNDKLLDYVVLQTMIPRYLTVESYLVKVLSEYIPREIVEKTVCSLKIRGLLEVPNEGYITRTDSGQKYWESLDPQFTEHFRFGRLPDNELLRALYENPKMQPIIEKRFRNRLVDPKLERKLVATVNVEDPSSEQVLIEALKEKSIILVSDSKRPPGEWDIYRVERVQLKTMSE